MNFSVVIPTLGQRLGDLTKALESIDANTLKPSEVLIINQGENIIETAGWRFNLFISIIQIDKKSLTQAENIGVEQAKGEIISILDDDVVLDKNYFFEIHKSFASDSQLQIIQGKIINHPHSKLLDLYWQIFGGAGDLKKNNHVRLFNFENTFYKSDSNTESFCMWASGCNQNVRKDVFEYEKFDAQLLKVGVGEDVDFSYRVYNRYGPKSILFQPRAKLAHHSVPAGRISTSNRLLIKRVNLLYFRYKNLSRPLTPGEHLRKIWYNLGRLISILIKTCGGDFNILIKFIQAEYFVYKYRKELKKLNIEWLNKKKFGEESKPLAKITHIFHYAPNKNK